LSQLRQMPGARDLENAWIRARLGEDGYLTGKDAEAAACDAQSVPVVTGTIDPDVIDQMIDLARNGETAATGQAGSARPAGTGAEAKTADRGGRPGTADSGAEGKAAGRAARGLPRSRGLSPEAWRALRYAMARLAIDLVSGPEGVAAILRRGLLEKPYSTPSLPLDIGYSESIPGHIRRAVLLRDKHCAWPRCGRPAAYCDVHHIRHKADGGETSVGGCILLCQFHHDVCIHRQGWRIVLHPDGTTTVFGPAGQTVHSHAQPAPRTELASARPQSVTDCGVPP
jgi:hypothetical protein